MLVHILFSFTALVNIIQAVPVRKWWGITIAEEPPQKSVEGLPYMLDYLKQHDQIQILRYPQEIIDKKLTSMDADLNNMSIEEQQLAHNIIDIALNPDHDDKKKLDSFKRALSLNLAIQKYILFQLVRRIDASEKYNSLRGLKAFLDEMELSSDDYLLPAILFQNPLSSDM